tara:strand:- start:75 stop:473 length:399 start_codon:yes stop_codon:yes gene_type:complete
MINSSILIAKIKRSNVDMVKTFFWKEKNHNTNLIELLFDDDEDLLMGYLEDKGYRWFLSNKRLFIPTELKTILLSDITEVDFDKLKTKPNDKTTNVELNIYTGKINNIVYFEKDTWYLFYDIFRWISANNKN